MATRDDLLAMLDLGGDGEPGEPVKARAGKAGGAAGAPGKAAGAHAFDVDEWGRRRGEDLARANPGVLVHPGRGLEAAAWADLHHAAFDPEPVLLDGCADPVRHEYLRELLETPDYRALHAATRLDPHASEAAAAEFAKGLAALKADRESKAAQAARADPPGAPGGGPAPGAPEGLDTLRAVGAALDAAERAVEEVKDAARGVFPGFGPGSEDGRGDPAAVAA